MSDLVELAARALARGVGAIWTAADYVFHRGPRPAPTPPPEGWYETDS